MSTESDQLLHLEKLRSSYSYLFNSGLSISKIKDAALTTRFLPSSTDGTTVAGRSIAWKLFLTSEEPLQSSSTPRRAFLLDSLRASRQMYIQLLGEKMRAPDGSYEEGFVIPGTLESPRRQSRATWNLETNNPLSLHRENPWREWFASIELRKTILQDVERTFPEIDFFRNPKVQSELTNILFLYSVMYPSIGYRQGMHEILAPLYHAVHFDSITQTETLSVEDSELADICSRLWVAADAWVLFDAVMRGISKWYEWRDSPPTSPPDRISSVSSRGYTSFSDGQVDIKPYIAPIVETCDRIQFHILRTTDPLLYKHMQGAGIEPQIYGIRWLRLLFTREFSMNDAMKLWDGLFACDPTFGLAPWVCVAMLIRIRNELLSADYTGQLTMLLRYPSPGPQGRDDGVPHHTTLLLRQAIALQMSPTPSTGASLTIENRNLLNIPVEGLVPSMPSQRNQSFNGLDNTAATLSRPSQRHTRQQASQPMGLPEIIARGLLERGESLRINKTLMSAVSELRRNIPDLAASLVRSPDASHPTFPLEDERPPEERPSWEPRSRFEVERDIAQLRSTNKRLGESLEWILDVLQTESEADDQERIRKQRHEALESLCYVKDVLIGKVSGIEDSKLTQSSNNRLLFRRLTIRLNRLVGKS
ncbi:RabGAP/TBC [Tricholoma matsutake]|nr:RabGAP/TBC [Tricholoma matsutake 945]